MLRHILIACLLATVAAPTVGALPCSTGTRLVAGTIAPLPNTVYLRPASSKADIATVDVAIQGPVASNDVFSFSFDVAIGNPKLVEFVSATVGPALDPTGCIDVFLLANLTADHLVVGVTKLGSCSGNGMDSTETIVSLQFRMLQEGSSVLALAPPFAARNSAGETIPEIVFDTAPALLMRLDNLDGGSAPDCSDLCVAESDPPQADADADGVGDFCDNCPLERNRSQADGDVDGEGDACDVDDGQILIRFESQDTVAWQDEQGFMSWNVYRGDLAYLTGNGVYSQDPGTNELAERGCEWNLNFANDPSVPGEGEVCFFLVAGNQEDGEGPLGENSDGAERAHDNPCPLVGWR